MYIEISSVYVSVFSFITVGPNSFRRFIGGKHWSGREGVSFFLMNNPTVKENKKYALKCESYSCINLNRCDSSCINF